MKQLTHRARNELPVSVWSRLYLSTSWLKTSCWAETLLHGQNWYQPLKSDTDVAAGKQTNKCPGQAMLSFPSCHWAHKLAEYFMLDASQSHPQSSGFYKPNHKQKPNLGMQNLLRNQKRNINCQFFPKGTGRRGWIKEFYKMQSKSPHCLLHGKS